MKKALLLLLLVISYKVSSQYTQIPDPNFEQALIDLNVDNVLDGQVLTASIDTLTVLNVSNKNIDDLTGIQDFTNLKILSAVWNNLTQINISNLNYLESVYVYDNNITSLSITGCPVLYEVFCQENSIDYINLQGDYSLNTLIADTNHISEIDVTGMPMLYDLILHHNQIEQIDLSNNYYLQNLLIHFNNLSGLDLSNNHKLMQVTCAKNPNLSGTLDLSQDYLMWIVEISYTGIEVLNLKNGNNSSSLVIRANECNNLSCIIVDNPQAGYIDNWQYPPGTNIVDNINDCYNAVGINSEYEISLYPSPADEKIFFSGDEINFQTANIYDLTGKLFKTIDVNFENYINVKDLPGGFYILKLQNDEMEIIKKIIVKH